MNGDNSEKRTKVDVLILTGEQNNGELFSEVHAASTQVAIKGYQNAEQMGGYNSEKRTKVDVLILTGEQNNGELFSEVHAASTQVAIKGDQNAEQINGDNPEKRSKVDVLIFTGEQNNGELFTEVHAASTQVAIKGDQITEQMGGDIFEERRQVQGFTSNASGQKSDQMEIELEKSAHKIQTWWRGRKQRIKYLRLRSMTLHIQAFARGYLERSSLFDDKRAGDTLYRYYLNAVKNSGVENMESLGSFSVQLKYFVEKKAAYKIADYLKCLLKSRQARDEFIAKRRAAVVIQNAFRNYKSIKAARLYLNLVREKKNQEMVAERKKTEEKAAILIQKGLRSYINTKQTRNRFIVQKCAAIIIQRAVRAFFTRKRYIEIQQRRRLSANVISSWYRARREICVERRNYRLKIEKIVQLQSLVRGYLFRKELKRRTEAAIVIQAKIRSNLQRRNFLKLKSACMKIQRIFRDKQADKLHEHEIYLEKVVLAQNCVRKFIARKKFERMCSVIEPVKKSFVEIRSAIIIQRKFRKVRGKLLLRYYTTRLHRSALKIQRLWRGYCLRRDLEYFRENVITIQRAYRNYKECKDLKIELETKMKSVIKIQSVCRGFIVKKNFNLPKMKQAVKVIWKFYMDNKEGYIQRRTELRAAIKIQSIWRGYRTRSANRVPELPENNSEQQHQHHHHQHQQQHNVDHVVAVSCHSPTEAEKKQRRLSEIYSNLRSLDPDSLPLRARMATGLANLLNLNMVSKIIPVLSDIEVCTRWSEACCIQFTTATVSDRSSLTNGSDHHPNHHHHHQNHSAIRSPETNSDNECANPTSVLIELMERCCRSVADQDILLLCVQIFINVVKVKTCQDSLKKDQRLFPFLLSQLGKNNPSACKGTSAAKLYCHTCFLLQILLHFQQCQKIAKSYSRLIEKLRRQHQSEAIKERNIQKSHAQHSISSSSTTAATPGIKGGTGKKKGVQKLAFNLKHVHPAWELKQTRLEPCTSVVMALEAFLEQLKVTFDRTC